MRIYHFFLMLVALPNVVTAQESTEQALTVEQAVTIAINHNPVTSAIVRDLHSAESGLRSAGAFANPSITFTPAITTGGSDEELLIQQPLEINGARAARVGLAKAQLTETRAMGIVELRTLIFETKAAFYDLVRARQQTALSKSLYDFFQDVDKATRRHVEVGTRAGIDQITTGIELVRANQDLTLAEGEEERSLAALNTLLGRLPDEPLGPLTEPETTATPLDEKDLLEQALLARAEITADSARAEALRREAELVRAEGRPDLVPQYRAAGITQGEKASGFGIGISIPLLDYGSRRSRINQLEEAAKAQEARVEATRNEVRRDVSQAIASIRSADMVVKRFEDGILDEAKQLLDSTQRGFQLGQTTIISLLEAQRTYRSVLSEYNTAVLEQAKARAALELAIGAVPMNTLDTLKENSQ